MKKIKKIYKRILYFVMAFAIAIIPIFSFTSYNASAANFMTQEDFTYVLPTISVSTSSSQYTYIPSLIFGINRNFDTTNKVFMYNNSGDSSLSVRRYARRTLTRSTTQFFTSSWAFATFYNTGTTINAYWMPSASVVDVFITPDIKTTQNFIFVQGRVIVGATYISIDLINSDADNGFASDFGQISITITFAQTGANIKNYTMTFNPTLISNTSTNNNYQQGYDYGYQLGKIDGYNKGFYDGAASSNDYTFRSLFSAIIDVPINAFKAIFNFQFLDINLLDFVTSLLTLVICIKVISMVL